MQLMRTNNSTFPRPHLADPRRPPHQHAAVCTVSQSARAAAKPLGHAANRREALGPSRSSANRDRRWSSDLGFFCSMEGRLTGGAGRAGRGGEGTRPGYRTLLSNTPLLKGRVESEALLGAV